MLIDSSNYTTLEFGELKNITESNYFAGYDPVANKAYSAVYSSSDVNNVEYKIYDAAFDPSSNIADEIARDTFNSQELLKPSKKIVESKTQEQPLRFGVVIKAENEDQGSDSDSLSEDNADLFQAVVETKKTKLPKKIEPVLKAAKSKPNSNYAMFYSLIDFLTCRLNNRINKGLLRSDSQSYYDEDGFLQNVLCTPFVLETN